MFKHRWTCFVLAAFFAFANTAFVYADSTPLAVNKLIVMPARDGHADWIEAIDGATLSVHLEMYHLTDRAVIAALANKAKAGVEVQVIVDGASFKGGNQKAVVPMIAAGVEVRPSTSAFSLTHEKGMIVDGKTSFVTAINLTNTAATSRDFGIITPDPSVAAEMESVFRADWQNSQTGDNATPALQQSNLLWSPTDARPKLVGLIDSASTSLIMQVESFNDQTMVEAFARAVRRGVDVRLMTPECIFGSNGIYNFAALLKLTAVGAHAHVMPKPNSFEHPYIHSKMMVIDRAEIYLGSVNFTHNSLDKDRELGVIFADPEVAAKMSDIFDQDWAASIEPDANPTQALCHAS